MSTSVPAVPAAVRPLPGRRYDRVFFPFLAFLCLVYVVIGFSRSYFMAGVFHAPLPSRTIHIHGAVFSAWILLVIVQTGLVAGRRLDLHKKLGHFGFGLAGVVTVMGLLAARDSLLRGKAPVPGISAGTFFIVPVSDIFIFATIVYFGWALRNRGLDHKRLMMVATIALLDAAVARWPFAYLESLSLGLLTLYAPLLLLFAYDLWSTHKVQKATVYASLLVIVVQQIRIPIGMSHPWLRFADMVAGKF